MLTITSPYVQFTELDGSPLDDGAVYIGTAGLNPQTNPITVYWDNAGTQPASQPIKTRSGVIARNGAPARVYISASSYSLMVRDKRGRLVASELSITADIGTDNITDGAVTISKLESSVASLVNGALQKTGGTMTGAIVLPGNAVNALEAMPLQQATGRLLAVRVFTTANTGQTYTPTAGATSVVVQAVGGGGAGGGVSATGVGQTSLSLGGGAGAYGVSRFTSGFSGATLTIGSGGTPAIGASGGNGGTTSFGALLSCPGGPGAGVGLAVSSAQNFSSVGSPYPLAPSGANISQSIGVGKPGVICLNGWGYLAGSGADSPLGSGGQGIGGSGAAQAGYGYGSGGSGVANDPSSAARAGGAGAPGVIIVWEYA